jgi:hypothetical protein
MTRPDDPRALLRNSRTICPVTAILGRLFQLIGLLLLPIGLSYGLLKDNIGIEVRLLFIGGAFFVLGWLISRQKS